MNMKVKIYGIDECPYCDELKTLYDDNGIGYEYVDINLKEQTGEVDLIMSRANTDMVPIILVGKMILAPESSFKTIREAYLLTNKILSD